MDPGIRRAAEVALVTARRGSAALMDLLDMRVLLPGIHRPPPGVARAGPAQLRALLEDLGPTFMKLGQVLSTRPDLVPPSYETELAKLQDSGPTVPFAEVAAEVEEALGRPLHEVYADFDEQPIAAASIGQVHAATLHDGTEVVVKVRRPGVVDQVELDLELIQRVGAVAARVGVLARYDPKGLAAEFATTMRGEMDYTREAHNAEQVGAGFDGDDRVHVPRVFREHSRAAVITEERIRGFKIDDLDGLDAAGIDRVAVARAFADAYLSMVFVRGFFHADPHPGNVFVETHERIGFVDFGMVGAVAPPTLNGLGTVLLGLAAIDASRMCDGLLHLGVAGDEVDRPALERDLARLLERHAHVPLEQLHIGPLLVEVMGVVRAHRLRLPSDLALLLKTVMMCEGVAALLDPGFLLVPLLVPYASRLTLDADG